MYSKEIKVYHEDGKLRATIKLEEEVEDSTSYFVILHDGFRYVNHTLKEIMMEVFKVLSSVLTKRSIVPDEIKEDDLTSMDIYYICGNIEIMVFSIDKEDILEKYL